MFPSVETTYKMKCKTSKLQMYFKKCLQRFKQTQKVGTQVDLKIGHSETLEYSTACFFTFKKWTG